MTCNFENVEVVLLFQFISEFYKVLLIRRSFHGDTLVGAALVWAWTQLERAKTDVWGI